MPLNKLTINAIETAIKNDRKSILFTKGKMKGLIPGGKQTASKKAAIDECLNHEPQLFNVTKTNDNPENYLVEVTKSGIDLLIASLDSNQQVELYNDSHEYYKKLLQESFDETRVEEMRNLNIQIKQLSEKRSHLLNESIDQFNADILALQNQLAIIKELQKSDCLPKDVYHSKLNNHDTKIAPSSDSELDFQLHVCRELVYAWQDSEDSVREALIPVMLNAGLERKGVIGEVVKFDNRDHQSKDKVLPNQNVIVIDNGWRLVSYRGEYEIAPILVKSN